MNRQEAELKLKYIFGFDNFFDDQWKTIDRILQKKRVLLIEKTGFGKTFKEQKFDLLLFVPPTKSGKLVENFAIKIASTLQLPIFPLLKIRDTKEQKIFQNNSLKTENIKNAFTINFNIINKSILLIDDIFDSGATIKEIGKMLSNKGAKFIAPLVIAKTVGGDIV